MKRSRIATKPKQGRKALIAQADAMVQEIVVGRGRKCQMCGKERATDGHHIIKRRFHALRWQTKYIIDLCHECHELDKHPTRKAELKARCIEWLGGQQVYERLRRYAENAPPEEPEEAIRRMSDCE
jgi:hypothetical protein